jgi:hypothetical protein
LLLLVAAVWFLKQPWEAKKEMAAWGGARVADHVHFSDAWRAWSITIRGPWTSGIGADGTITVSKRITCDTFIATNMKPGPDVFGGEPVERRTSTWVSIFLAIYLIVIFLWRALVTAHELPSPGLRNLTIGLDVLCVVGLIGLWIQGSRAVPKRISSGMHFLFFISVLSGLGLFAIRANGTESFWTGHIKYGLLPRTDHPSDRK